MNNDQHISHLGAAFFTKVLHFAGGESSAGPYRPVISGQRRLASSKRPGNVRCRLAGERLDHGPVQAVPESPRFEWRLDFMKGSSHGTTFPLPA
ncbi:8-oxoguanine DNA glycosylase OGG fold protein [Streptomyces sp. NBC_01236]|uniref:8-oxoguanine DNA glycosylase OGG fold protein n=1 Tax=Streptomyces sp. NBC_01236 TaxID=2903789 RepID=UPI003FA3C3FF